MKGECESQSERVCSSACGLLSDWLGLIQETAGSWPLLRSVKNWMASRLCCQKPGEFTWLSA